MSVDTVATLPQSVPPQHAVDADVYLTVAEAAARAKACAATIRRAIAEPRGLRAVRVGQHYRIRPSWLDDWLARLAGPRLLSTQQREAMSARCRKAVVTRWEEVRRKREEALQQISA